ncbi:MAG: DUF4838 domain-containing protein [Planctomycetota bacterium]|nr:DUF4838 domain-containing protein [Planctomycetota bacterium]
MKSFITPICILFLMAVAASAADKTLDIVAAGKSDYVIVTPVKPAPPVQTAAKELQEHLAKATGAKLEILAEDKAAADAKQILVGPSNRAKKLLPGIDPAKLGHDGIVMRTVGSNIVLMGRPPRGTLYAVYTFLEDVVGCRWWTSTESFVPKKPDLSVPTLDVNYAPSIRSREAYYRDAFEGRFAARSKCNGNMVRCGPELGGHYSFAGFVHTFYPLLPPEKYFKDHPEWYSLLGGKRTTNRAQLCLTNEEMRKEFIKNALARLKATPGANIISISQNDWHGQCQCQKCKAIDDAEGSPAGSLLQFVNAVAAEIEKVYPDVLVETLAYQYTRKPPRTIRPRRNVVIRLCSIECCFSQPLGEGEHNKRFRDDMEGWSKIAPRLFVWDYVTNFSNYILPHPNMRVLAPNIRFFVKNNVIGLFEQGDAGSTVGDFIRLRAWLLAKLMWNPELDDQALIREFVEGYYGPAAPHILEYLKIIHDAGDRSGTHLRCFTQNTNGYLKPADLIAAREAFDKALDAVEGDKTLSRRVRRERLPLDHVWLNRYGELARTAKLAGKELPGPKDPMVLCEEYIRLAREHKVGNWRERHPFREYEERLRRKVRPAGPPPEQCKHLHKDQWLDIQDNSFRYSQYGKWATIVDDKKASDGKAARMPGDHHEWAVSYPFSADLAKGGPWRCYVVARCEASGDGKAMTMGIYDSKAKKSVSYKTLAVKDFSGKDYQVFDLGTHKLHDRMYVWCAPPKRPGEVQAVYVDRVYLVREKDGK